MLLAEDFVERMAGMASHAYLEYQIPKRSGGTRRIAQPSQELKALQRWLLYNILPRLPVHQAAVAYRHGLSIADQHQTGASDRFVAVNGKN